MSVGAGDAPVPDHKVVFLGNGGIGKTCLRQRMVSDEYLDTSPTLAPGALQQRVDLPDGRTVMLGLWDTAGQEKYLSLTTMFLRDAEIAVLSHTPFTVKADDDAPAFDIEAAKQEWRDSIARWSGALNDSSDGGCQVVLATTKADMLDTWEEEWNQFGEQLREENGFAGYFVTSAMTGDGVVDLKLAVATLAHERAHPPLPPVVAVADGQGDPNKTGPGCC
jgi:GTPase SAR1 family protein